MRILRRLVIRAVLTIARPSKFCVENRGVFDRVRAPYIILCNHPALVDSLYLILAAPHELTVCGAKPRYFSSFLKRRLMAFLRIMKVESHDQYLSDCRRLFEAGRCLLLYPEMGRNPRGLGAFESWAADLALATGAPLLPCFIDGTHESQRGPVTLHVGEPFTPSPMNADRLTADFFERIQALAPRTGS